MTKAVEMAKISAKGSFDMLWGLVVSTLIMSVATIFIARLLGPNQYGLYTVILAVPLFIGIFRDFAVNSAMVKFTAQFRAEGRMDEIRSVFLSGILFELIAGFILSAISFLLSSYIATDVFNRPSITPYIQVASFVILATGLINAATGAFTGYEKMGHNSIMLIAQSISKAAIIIVLVVLGLGAPGATEGFTAGVFAAGLIGTALVWMIYRQLPKPVNYKYHLNAYLTAMLTYCLPLSFATLILSLYPYFFTFLLPIYYKTSNVIIGDYGIAANFVVLITFFSTPINTMVFPAFSKFDGQKDKEALYNAFKYSIKYASLIVVPITVLVICLAKPGVETIFGTAYTSSALFLALLAIQYLYTAFGNLSLRPFLWAQGETVYALKMAILTGIIAFLFGYFAIMNFGVLGLIAATLIASVPSTMLGLRFVRKAYGLSVDWSSSGRIMLSSAIAGLAAYGSVSLTSFSNLVQLVIGTVTFTVTLVPLAVLTKSFNRSDIANFRLMTTNFGIVGKPLNSLLNILEQIMKTLTPERPIDQHLQLIELRSKE